jgi:hypothetical protein
MEVLSGETLVRTLVSLSDLPQPLAQKEVNTILEFSGQEAENLTLDQLREAMLTYLEEIQASFEAEGAFDTEQDTGRSKPSVFFE